MASRMGFETGYFSTLRRIANLRQQTDDPARRAFLSDVYRDAEYNFVPRYPHGAEWYVPRITALYKRDPKLVTNPVLLLLCLSENNAQNLLDICPK